MERLPVMTTITEKEIDIIRRQQGFQERLRKSKYYVVERTKSNGMPCCPYIHAEAQQTARTSKIFR